MTDEQRLATLLSEFGVAFNTIGHEPGTREARIAPAGQTIVIAADDGPNIGYVGLEACFVFAEGGKFIQVGIWE